MKTKKIVYGIALCSMTVFSFSAFGDEPEIEQPSDWQFKVGGGVGFAPDYEGSDDYEASFIPDVEVVWKDRVSLSMGGLAVDVLQTENLTFGVGAGLSGGRKESDNEALRGLGKIDSSVEGIIYGGYAFDMFEVSAEIAHDLGDGHEGTQIGLEANAFLPVSEKLVFIAGPDVTWASDDYMQSFFGITNKQAASSAYSKFDAGAGFKDVGLHLMAEYKVTESVSVNAMVQYKKLLGDAADSPLVKNKGSDNQLFGGLTLSYSF